MTNTQAPIFQNVAVDIDSLPHVEEVEFKGVSPKYKSLQAIYSIPMSLGFGGFAVGTSRLANAEWMITVPIALAVALLFFVIRTMIVSKAFLWKGYALRERDVIYRTGLIWRKVIVIPFARIQHGELSEGLLERSYGLAKLKLYTAGGASSDLSIPAIPAEEAERLRSFIMKRVIEEAEDQPNEEAVEE